MQKIWCLSNIYINLLCKCFGYILNIVGDEESAKTLSFHYHHLDNIMLVKQGILKKHIFSVLKQYIDYTVTWAFLCSSTEPTTNRFHFIVFYRQLIITNLPLWTQFIECLSWLLGNGVDGRLQQISVVNICSND